MIDNLHEPASEAIPSTPEQAVLRLRAVALPPTIVGVLRTLQQAGHAGVLVGGTVRDCLLGAKDGGDWDVATSATPDEVSQLFRRTIPTGIQHGTVTVLVGRKGETSPVEVTTFRGEGAYEDGRRPSEVRFHRDLRADLERRDFTVNAFGWDPLSGTFTDCFQGLDDLAAGVLRAVGDPVARFREDGLRTMRAVRFCATLQFALDPATEAAIPRALDVFDRVSGERVRVELCKLLAAERPSLGLVPMFRTGLWTRLFPAATDDRSEGLLVRIDAMVPDPMVRLARLLRPLAHRSENHAALEPAVDRLRLSREERRRLTTMLGPGLERLARADDAAAIRRAAAALGRDAFEDALAVLDADPERVTQVRQACADVPLEVRELAVKGGDLIAAGVVTPGPRVGAILQRLLEQVWDEGCPNEGEALLAWAREHAAP